jgi:hypothetical protein
MINDSSLFLDNMTCPVDGDMISYISFSSIINIVFSCITFGILLILPILLILIWVFTIILLCSIFYTCLMYFGTCHDVLDDDFADDMKSSLTEKHFPKDRID